MGKLRVRQRAERPDEDAAVAQHADLLVARAADTKDEIRLAVQVGGIRDDGDAGLAIRLVADARCLAGAGLDEHLDAVTDDLGGELWSECDPGLPGRRFAWDGDLHGCL